jgi:hypothetical protein
MLWGEVGLEEGGNEGWVWEEGVDRHIQLFKTDFKKAIP